MLVRKRSAVTVRHTLVQSGPPSGILLGQQTLDATLTQFLNSNPRPYAFLAGQARHKAVANNHVL